MLSSFMETRKETPNKRYALLRQYILDLVGNVIYCFVANLTDFPAFVKIGYDLAKLSSQLTRFLRQSVESPVKCIKVM